MRPRLQPNTRLYYFDVDRDLRTSDRRTSARNFSSTTTTKPPAATTISNHHRQSCWPCLCKRSIGCGIVFISSSCQSPIIRYRAFFFIPFIEIVRPLRLRNLSLSIYRRVAITRRSLCDLLSIRYTFLIMMEYSLRRSWFAVASVLVAFCGLLTSGKYQHHTHNGTRLRQINAFWVVCKKINK